MCYYNYKYASQYKKKDKVSVGYRLYVTNRVSQCTEGRVRFRSKSPFLTSGADPRTFSARRKMHGVFIMVGIRRRLAAINWL